MLRWWRDSISESSDELSQVEQGCFPKLTNGWLRRGHEYLHREGERKSESGRGGRVHYSLDVMVTMSSLSFLGKNLGLISSPNWILKYFISSFSIMIFQIFASYAIACCSHSILKNGIIPEGRLSINVSFLGYCTAEQMLNCFSKSILLSVSHTRWFFFITFNSSKNCYLTKVTYLSLSAPGFAK